VRPDPQINSHNLAKTRKHGCAPLLLAKRGTN
jgi:hypothetical protein